MKSSLSFKNLLTSTKWGRIGNLLMRLLNWHCILGGSDDSAYYQRNHFQIYYGWHEYLNILLL